MPIMRQSLDETDCPIAAALLASPRASWREVARCLGLSERAVVRRAAPLYADGTPRATVVRNPAHFHRLIPRVQRIRSRPNKIRQVTHALARRTDTVWVDILGGGEISTVLFLDGLDARNTLLLHDLPATDAVGAWTSHTLLRVFPTAFRWTAAGLLSPEEQARLDPDPAQPTAPPRPSASTPRRPSASTRTSASAPPPAPPISSSRSSHSSHSSPHPPHPSGSVTSGPARVRGFRFHGTPEGAPACVVAAA